MRLKKKALSMYTADTVLFYTLDVILFSFILIFFMLYIYNLLEDSAQIPEGMEEFSAVQRFTAGECFSADSIQAIDWNKFTKENLDLCYSPQQGNKAAYSIKLMVKGTTKEYYTSNWNKDIAINKVLNPKTVNILYENELNENEVTQGKMIISEQNV